MRKSSIFAALAGIAAAVPEQPPSKTRGRGTSRANRLKQIAMGFTVKQRTPTTAWDFRRLDLAAAKRVRKNRARRMHADFTRMGQVDARYYLSRHR